MQIPLRMRKELNICPALPIMTKKQGITMPAIMKKICSTKRTAKPENSNTQKRQTISSRCRTLFRAARNRQSSGAAAKKGMGAPMFPFLFCMGRISGMVRRPRVQNAILTTGGSVSEADLPLQRHSHYSFFTAYVHIPS